jgi:hypothetical protein
MVLLAQHCPNLQRLNLNRCDLISTLTVQEFAKQLATKAEREGIDSLNLTVLNLSRPLLNQRTSISDESIASLLRVTPKLMELRLRNCEHVSDRTVIEMAKTCGKSLLALDLRLV